MNRIDIINDVLKPSISNIQKVQRLLAKSVCPACEGFGRIQVRLASEGAGMHASFPTKCKTCDGTGSVENTEEDK